MPKTILLPQQLATDVYHRPKVVVRQESEFRDSKGNLLHGWYLFEFNGKIYSIHYVYKRHEVIKSQLLCIK